MSSTSQDQTKQHLAGLAMGAIGVVFGDIGTSPLYALKEIFLSGLTIDRLHVFGALSLVFLDINAGCNYQIRNFYYACR
jgi:KUP system potassium uptake protein